MLRTTNRSTDIQTGLDAHLHTLRVKLSIIYSEVHLYTPSELTKCPIPVCEILLNYTLLELNKNYELFKSQGLIHMYNARGIKYHHLLTPSQVKRLFL